MFESIWIVFPFCKDIEFKNDEDVQQYASDNFYAVPTKT